MPILLHNHPLFTLRFVLSLSELLCLPLGNLKLVHHSLLLFLAAHQRDVKVVLLLALLIQNVFLLVESFLQAGLVLLKTTRAYYTIALLMLQQDIILSQRLLEHSPEAHAFLGQSLNFIVILA